jgi:hypothetical protein
MTAGKILTMRAMVHVWLIDLALNLSITSLQRSTMSHWKRRLVGSFDTPLPVAFSGGLLEAVRVRVPEEWIAEEGESEFPEVAEGTNGIEDEDAEGLEDAAAEDGSPVGGTARIEEGFPAIGALVPWLGPSVI